MRRWTCLHRGSGSTYTVEWFSRQMTSLCIATRTAFALFSLTRCAQSAEIKGLGSGAGTIVSIHTLRPSRDEALHRDPGRQSPMTGVALCHSSCKHGCARRRRLCRNDPPTDTRGAKRSNRTLPPAAASCVSHLLVGELDRVWRQISGPRHARPQRIRSCWIRVAALPRESRPCGLIHMQSTNSSYTGRSSSGRSSRRS